MLPSFRMLLILSAAGILFPGCRVPVAQQVQVGQDSLAEAVVSDMPSDKVAPAESGKAQVDSADAAWEKSVEELVADLPNLDAKLKSELVDNLSNTSPELREQTIRMYRAIAAREAQAAKLEAAEEAEAEEPALAAKVVQSETPSQPPVVPTKRLPEQANETAIPSGSKLAEYPTTDSPSSQPVPAKAQAIAAASIPQEVELASHVVESSPEDLSWRTHLERTIASLKKQTRPDPSNSDEVRDHVALRMLLLAAGKREEALEPIPGVPLAQQDFWTKEFYGLSTYLDHEKNPDAGRRAGQAREYLNEASVILGELGTLDVRNLAFCSEARTYGVYKKFEKYEFKPGQEVVLYAEVENFSSEETEDGFHTALRSSFQILDSTGKRVHAKDFAAIEDDCQSRRRDFPMRYNLFLPKRIWEGTYTLQLTIEDVHSLKIGQASVEFEIKE